MNEITREVLVVHQTRELSRHPGKVVKPGDVFVQVDHVHKRPTWKRFTQVEQHLEFDGYSYYLDDSDYRVCTRSMTKVEIKPETMLVRVCLKTHRSTTSPELHIQAGQTFVLIKGVGWARVVDGMLNPGEKIVPSQLDVQYFSLPMEVEFDS